VTRARELKAIKSKAVCDMLDISPPTLSRLVKADAIPFINVGTANQPAYRFIEEKIIAWAEAGGNRKREKRPTRRTVARASGRDQLVPDMVPTATNNGQVVEFSTVRLVQQNG
jgi:hypothetical protein